MRTSHGGYERSDSLGCQFQLSEAAITVTCRSDEDYLRSHRPGLRDPERRGRGRLITQIWTWITSSTTRAGKTSRSWRKPSFELGSTHAPVVTSNLLEWPEHTTNVPSTSGRPPSWVP